MKPLRVLSALCLGAGVVALAAASSSAQSNHVGWVGFGDSYSAGEGLPFVSKEPERDKRCQRAPATDAETSTAWAPAAVEEFQRQDPDLGLTIDFVACTGAITDDILSSGSSIQDRQLAEALGTLESATPYSSFGTKKWDVVSLSMGGNNILFADVLYQCIGVSVEGGATALFGAVTGTGAVTLWSLAPWIGCDVSEEDIKDRIDALTDARSVDGDDFQSCPSSGSSEASAAGYWDDDDGRSVPNAGAVTVPELFHFIARCVVKPGGTVVVMGYPQLIDETRFWSRVEGNRCHRVRRADVQRLRGAAAHLNHMLRLAAEDADRSFDGDFLFVDVNQFWEGERYDGSDPSPQDREDRARRHALCGPGTDWLNGITVGGTGDGLFRLARSFHPNQDGHDHMARAVTTRLGTGDLRAPASASLTFDSATSLVIDTSSSMEELTAGGTETKIAAAKKAAAGVVTVVENQASTVSSGASATPGNHVAGVVEFSSAASTVVSPTDDMGSVRSAVQSLGIGSNTNIGAGLELGIDQLLSGVGGNKALVLLSDGLTNEGMSADQILTDLVPKATAAGIKIHTVGFGEAGTGTVDEALLQRIASATGGEYSFAETETALQQSFMVARASTLGTVQHSSLGEVAQGQTTNAGRIALDENLGELEVTLAWPGSDLDVVLRDPDGEVVDDAYGGAQIFRTNPEVVIVTEPKDGDWTLDVQGIDVPGPTEEYAIVASTRGVAPPDPESGLRGALVVAVGILVLVVGGVVGGVMLCRRPTSPHLVCGACETDLPVDARVCDRCGAPAARALGLRVVAGPETGRLLRVAPNETIGRGDEAHHRLADETVSRGHVVVTWELGSWVVTDLGSTSGTLRNGDLVAQARLVEGDHLALGDTIFVVEELQHARPTTASQVP